MLKYARTFEAVVSLFDSPALMARYTFVLEPCWAGYWDPEHSDVHRGAAPVFVQCFTEEDHEVIARDWARLWSRFGSDRPTGSTPICSGRRQNDQDKTYDVVMVANWGVHKRHAELFRALRESGHRERTRRC